MYRILPLRTLRRTAGVIFDEVAKSDIPKIDGIDSNSQGKQHFTMTFRKR